MNVIFYGSLLRIAQALAMAAPTIMIGLIVAASLRWLLGSAATRRLFGVGTWRALPQAWLLGMLLPVCSLGVLPILREMKRSGVSGGTLLAFGLTAPLFNPISVLYGLTLADPVVIITFSFCSLVIVTALGFLWDCFFKAEPVDDEKYQPAGVGIRRVVAIGSESTSQIFGPTGLYMLLGLLGVGTLAALIPVGHLQTAVEPDDPFAPLVITTVGIPVYADPMTAMVQLANMFQHGNSVGAAFALLVLGAGANIGTVVFVLANYRWWHSLSWLVSLVGFVLLIAYMVEKPLYPKGIESAGHTHAFDSYCAPFHDNVKDPIEKAIQKFREDIEVYQQASLGMLGLMALAGVVFLFVNRGDRLDNWIQDAPKKLSYDFRLPGRVVGAIGFVTIVLLSIGGCYVYYPAKSEIFAEMKIVNTEVVSAASSGEYETGLYWIPIYDDWTRKMEVSLVLRGQRLTPFQLAKMEVLRDKLEMLEHSLELEAKGRSEKLGKEVNLAYLRMKYAMSDDKE